MLYICWKIFEYGAHFSTNNTHFTHSFIYRCYHVFFNVYYMNVCGANAIFKAHTIWVAWYIKLKEIPHHQINSNRALFCEIELGNKSSISSISSHFLSVSLIIKMYFNILLFFLLHFYNFIDFHSHLPSSRINIFINVSEHFFNFLFERCLRVKNGVQFVKYMMKEVLSS